MPIRARVGRHANTGVQCQNWAEDQQTVIAMLNVIPPAEGGAETPLAGRVVAGVSSDALFKAILRFEKQHFPTQQSGFLDPGGAVLSRMEALVLRPIPAPATTGPWGEFKSGSVPRALREVLSDDHRLSQVKVVEILRSTLKNGTLSDDELDDLQMVSDKSQTIMPRSKAMLESFVTEARAKIKKLGSYKLGTLQQMAAANLACDFMRRLGPGFWPKLDRDKVGIGLLMRIAYPGLLRQGSASLCGPASILFNLLQDRPAQYALFATTLFDHREAKLVALTIKPKGKILNYAPPIDPIDWLTMASIRDSENWFLDYDTADKEFAGATTPMELANWFHKAGYYDVREDANFVRHQRGGESIKEANELFKSGYRVCLLIGGNMIETKDQAKSASLPDHWVVLRSTIDVSDDKVNMKIFTWGDGEYKVPQSGDLPLKDFLMNYYGYVAAKP